MKDIKNFLVNESNDDALWDKANDILEELENYMDGSELVNEILNKLGPKQSLSILEEIKKEVE